MLESYTGNYDHGELLPLDQLVPSQLPIYVGMKAFCASTVRTDLDYVNGMEVEVISWSTRNQAVRVLTKTGRTFDVTKWYDADAGGLCYYPLRVGYASTILRMAGAQLQHVTVYLDYPNVAAAAYTALSRVATLKQILIGGAATSDHFAPARN